MGPFCFQKEARQTRQNAVGVIKTRLSRLQHRKIGTAGAPAKRCDLPAAGKLTARKVRVTDGSVDISGQFVTCPDVYIVPDEVATLSCHVAVESRVGDRAGAATEKIVKTVRTAREPIPTVAHGHLRLTHRRNRVRHKPGSDRGR